MALREPSLNHPDRQVVLSENQTQPGHYLGTFVALVLPGLGWEMSVPQTAASSQDKLVHSSVPDISSFPHEVPSDQESSSKEGDLDAEFGGIGMLNYSTSSRNWSQSSRSPCEEQGLAKHPRDSADLPSSCPAHRRFLLSEK